MRVLLFSTIGNDNYGDESMAINFARKLPENYVIEFTTERYNNISGKYPEYSFYNALEEWIIGRILKALIIIHAVFGLKSKILVPSLEGEVEEYVGFYMCGGGNLNSIYANNIFQMYCLAIYFKSVGKKVIFRPQSLGPFKGFKGYLHKIIVKRLVKLSDEFYVRESTSFKMFDSLSESNNFILKIDDAWDLRIESIDWDKLDSKKKKVGICLRSWGEQELVISWIKRIVESVPSSDYDFYFIPIAYGGESSYIDNQVFKGEISSNENVHYLDDDFELKDLKSGNIKWIISNMDLCFGLSYHFNVFSAALRKKAIGVYFDKYYEIKNSGFYNLIRLPHNVYSYRNLNPEDVIVKLESAETVSEKFNDEIR